ncbi:papain family cysteine protease domain-containing protein [Ditylenchus destructor]|nr:papain family cysteine protease domain-containing protein [Ditylenchus destructor]
MDPGPGETSGTAPILPSVPVVKEPTVKPFDLREIPHRIYNLTHEQGQNDICWAFGAVALVEAANARFFYPTNKKERKPEKDQKEYRFSVQHFLDEFSAVYPKKKTTGNSSYDPLLFCMRPSGIRSMPPFKAKWLQVKLEGCRTGLVLEKEYEKDEGYAYTGVANTRRNHKARSYARYYIKGFETFQTTNKTAEQDMINYLTREELPISCSILPPEDFLEIDSIAKVYNPTKKEQEKVEAQEKVGEASKHNVLIVGFGENTELRYWIIKNSYLTNANTQGPWGDGKGFGTIARGVNCCQIETAGTHVIVIP